MRLLNQTLVLGALVAVLTGTAISYVHAQNAEKPNMFVTAAYTLTSAPSPYWAPTRKPALTIFGKTRAPFALGASLFAAGEVSRSSAIAACTSLSRAVRSWAAADNDPRVTPMSKKRGSNLDGSEKI